MDGWMVGLIDRQTDREREEDGQTDRQIYRQT